MMKIINKFFFHVDEGSDEVINCMLLVSFFEEVIKIGEIDFNARALKRS